MASTGAGIGMHLNISITDEILSKNPGFSSLLQNLGKRISTIQNNKAAEIKDVETKYKKVKSDYFEQLIFYSALMEIFIKQGNKEIQSFLPEDQVFREVHMRFASAEARCFLEACSKEGATGDIFTEMRTELLAEDKANYTHEDVKKVIVTKIEKWLSEKESSVLQCYFQKDNVPVSSSSRLAVFLEKDMKTCQLDRQKLRSEQMANQRLLAKYSEALLHATCLLIKILDTISFELQVNYNQTVVDTQISKCKALNLKAKSILLQIQKETYTPDAITALKSVKYMLDKKEKESQRKILDMSSSLSAYEKLGTSFEQLADEVRNLNHDLELNKWTLNHYQQ